MGYKLTGMYIGQDKIRPSGWQPGASTLLYLPLNSTDTYTDKSGNNVGVTNYNVTFGVNQGVDCGVFNTTTRLSVTPFSIPFSNYTFFMWAYCTGHEGDAKIIDMRYNIQLVFCYWDTHGFAFTGIKDSGGNVINIEPGRTYMNQWVFVGATLDNGTMTFFIKGNGLDSSVTQGIELNSTVTPDYITIGQEYNDAAPRHYSGYLSNIILEDKVRTAQEIAGYYNQTKGNYGI